MTTERFFKLEELPPDTRIRNNIFPSLLFPANAPIRAGDLQLQVLSVNDRKDTVTLKLLGVFVKPKTDKDENVETVEDNKPIIVVPEKKIIT
jgi:hypothetical protein